MTETQSYDQRVSRLAAARRKDTATKRAAIIKAIADLRREDRRINRRVVITRAGVHRNFLQRHKDLAALIDEAAGGPRPDEHPRPQDRLTYESMRAELAAANSRNRELQQKLGILERRLGALGPSIGPALVEQHPTVVELRMRLAQAELDAMDKDRTIAAMQDDIDILRETNRSLVREFGLQRS
jgi:hypothetical protein